MNNGEGNRGTLTSVMNFCLTRTTTHVSLTNQSYASDSPSFPPLPRPPAISRADHESPSTRRSHRRTLFHGLPHMQPSPLLALANTAEKRQRRPLILPFRWINIILHQRAVSSSLDAPMRTVLPSQKSCCSCHWQQSEHPTIPTAISGDPYSPFHHRSTMCKQLHCILALGKYNGIWAD